VSERSEKANQGLKTLETSPPARPHVDIKLLSATIPF